QRASPCRRCFKSSLRPMLLTRIETKWRGSRQNRCCRVSYVRVLFQPPRLPRLTSRIAHWQPDHAGRALGAQRPVVSKGGFDRGIALQSSAADDEPMSNYHVSQCTALINNPNVSPELWSLAEGLVAIASGTDDADS